MNRPRFSSGFSLIEVLLVIGVIAITMVAIFIAYPQVRERNQVNTENQRIFRIVGTVRNIYALNPEYTGLTTDVANLARAFPAEMNDGNYAVGQAIQHIWEGAVTLNVDPTNNRLFQITYAGVPSENCVMLATGVLQNFQRIEIPAGTVVYNKSVSTGVNIGAIAEACTSSGPLATLAFFTQ